MLPSTRRIKLNRNVLIGNNVPRRRQSSKLLPTATCETDCDPDQKMGKTLECSVQNCEVRKHNSVWEKAELKSENNVLNLGEEKGHRSMQTAVVEKTAFVPADSEEKPSTPFSECKGMTVSKINYLKNEGQPSTGNNFEVKVKGPYTRSKYVQNKVEGPYTRSNVKSETRPNWVKVEGPYTRSKYVQNKVEGPRTRSKSEMRPNGVTAGHKKSLGCRLQFALCFCCEVSNNKRLERKTFNKANSKGRNSRQVSYYMKCDRSVKYRVRERLARGAVQNRGFKNSKSACALTRKTSRDSVQIKTRSTERRRSKKTQKNAVEDPSRSQSVKKKYVAANDCVTLKLREKQGREGRCEGTSVEDSTSVSRSGKEPRTTNTGKDAGHGLRTFSLPTRISNVYGSPVVKHSHPKRSVSLQAFPQHSFGREVKSSCCTLCGDIKYTPPKRNKLSRVGSVGVTDGSRASIVCRRTGPKFRVKTRKTDTTTIKASKKLLIWIGRYPKVKLCDVGQACNGLIGDISCLLPAWLLTNKVVHCFKQDYRRHVRQLGPRCSSGAGHGSKTAREHLARKKSGHCSRFTSQRCTDTGEHGFADLSTNRSACLFTSEGGISEASNNSFASFSLGEQLMSKGESGAGIRDGDVLEGTGRDVVGSGSVAIVKETPVAKKRRLGVVENLTEQHQSSKREPALHSGIDTVPARCSEADSEVLCDVSLIHVNASDSPVWPHYSAAQDDDQRLRFGGNGRSEDSLLSDDPEENEADKDSDMCSCRRALPYERLEVSCSRTYVTWPFPKPDSAPLPSVRLSVHDGNGTLTPPMESDSSSGCGGNGALVSRDERLLESAERNRVLPSNGTLPEKTVTPTFPPKVQSEGASLVSSYSSSPTDEDIDLSCSLSKPDSASTFSSPKDGSETNTALSSSPSPDSDAPPSLFAFINARDVTLSSLQYNNNKEDEGDSYGVRDQRENLSSAAEKQAQTCPADDDDGVYTVNVTCADEEGQSSGDKTHKAVVKTQTCTDEFDKNQSTICKVKSVNKEGGTQSLLRLSKNQVEVAEGSKVKPARDPKADCLDEFTAYEHDILVVEALEDPELFSSMPQESDLRRVSTKRVRALKSRTSVRAGTALRSARPSLATQKSPTTCTDWLAGSNTDQRRIVPLKGENSTAVSPVASPIHSSPISALRHRRSFPLVDHMVLVEGGTDCNNNHYSTVKLDNTESYRHLAIQTMSSLPSSLPGDPWNQGCNAPLAVENVPQRYIDSYCKFYFNVSGCFHKICRFLHVPKKGDEKFCVDVVMRFIKTSKPACLRKAASVFTSYYQSSPPGIHYTPLVLNTLLTSLLKVGFLSDIKTVLHVSTAHNLLPHPELLLAVFDCFREKDQSALAELIQLTSEVQTRPPTYSAGNYIPNPENHRLSARPETQGLVHAFIDVERCTIQEDWTRLGMVFRSVCQSHRCLVELQHFSSRVAKALLIDTKDKLALPFACFAETVYQELVVWEDVLMRSFLGRIGVSLMCRYHQTQQWSKGQRLVKALSRLKVNYSTLKGLFSNQDGVSRCRLINIATELFLGSNSVEGALNTLRDNKWFLSSRGCPCSLEDITERKKVLVRLAEKTSYRETLEVLINLPGLKEPTELADISIYGCLFNSHLKSCVDRRTLSLAADTLDYMLSKNMAVDPPLLHSLLHKLGKQNNWLRARAVFKQALSLGYYAGVKAVPDSLSLTVPSSLGEIEIALALEMAMTLNAATILNAQDTPEPIVITLKRTGDSETEYLAAGSRLLSVGIVPNPKLIVHYTAVNSCREQLFTVDTHTALRWLRHNYTWANAVWAVGISTFPE